VVAGVCVTYYTRVERSIRISTPRRWRHGSGRSPGQAIVEFALILPVFLLLTLGVVDMARVFTTYIALTNGVSSSAIYAGQGGFLKWCATGGAVPCPAGTAAAQKITDPDNIAYQIHVEAGGLTESAIALSSPSCTITGTTTTENCTSTAPSAYSDVKIVAAYNVSLITPLMSTLMGGPIHLTASTTAVIQ
jgi:Flp pilus assembly protein TadG